MNKLKCPNCGAPISVENNKCPYCDVSYFDLSFIDINNNEPFYLKIRIGKTTLTQLVRILPDDINIELKSAQCYCYDSFGNKLFSVKPSNNEMFTNLKLEAVTDPYNKNRLCTVTYEK